MQSHLFSHGKTRRKQHVSVHELSKKIYVMQIIRRSCVTVLTRQMDMFLTNLFTSGHVKLKCSLRVSLKGVCTVYHTVLYCTMCFNLSLTSSFVSFYFALVSNKNINFL